MQRRLFLLILCVFAQPAYATKDVSSPNVDEGVLEFELRSSMEFDERDSREKRIRQVYIAEYGINRWWATRINIPVFKEYGKEWHTTAFEWENKFQLFTEKEDGFDGGFKAIVNRVIPQNTSDTVEVKLLGQKKWGAWRHRLTLDFEQEIGEDSRDELDFATTWQSMVKFDDTWSLGVEWFADFGPLASMPSYSEQEHQIGPIVSYAMNDTLSFDVGYLVGVSDAASDGLLKFFIKSAF